MRNPYEKSNDIESILSLSSEDSAKAEKIKTAAVIGSNATINRFVQEHFLGEGGLEITRALKQGGAFATGRGMLKERAFVSTEWWPDKHAEAVLEHEVMECICIYRNKGSDARDKLEKLGLSEPLDAYFLGKPNYSHYISVVYELRKAKELGILQEHLQLHRDNANKVKQATQYKDSTANLDLDFRQAVGELI